MSLIQLAFILFLAITAGGVLMAVLLVAKVKIPSFLPPAHGLGGLAAAALLFAADVQSVETPGRAWWALGVFTAGLVGGLLFFRVLFPKRAPLILVAGHGSLGIVGLVLLYGPAFPT